MRLRNYTLAGPADATQRLQLPEQLFAYRLVSVCFGYEATGVADNVNPIIQITDGLGGVLGDYTCGTGAVFVGAEEFRATFSSSPVFPPGSYPVLDGVMLIIGFLPPDLWITTDMRVNCVLSGAVSPGSGGTLWNFLNFTAQTVK